MAVEYWLIISPRKRLQQEQHNEINSQNTHHRGLMQSSAKVAKTWPAWWGITWYRLITYVFLFCTFFLNWVLCQRGCKAAVHCQNKTTPSSPCETNTLTDHCTRSFLKTAQHLSSFDFCCGAIDLHVISQNMIIEMQRKYSLWGINRLKSEGHWLASDSLARIGFFRIWE